MKFNAKSCAMMALLIGISIILSRFLSFYVPIFGLSAARIGFGSIPIILAGLLFGPLSGLVVGCLSDILGSIFFSGLGFFPGYTIGPMLIGLLAPLIAKYVFKNHFNYIKMLAILLPGELIATANTAFWFSYTSGANFFALFLPKAIISLVLTLITSWVVLKLYERVKKYSVSI